MIQMVSAIPTRIYGGASYAANAVKTLAQKVWGYVQNVFALLVPRKNVEVVPPAPPPSGRDSPDGDTVIVTARGHRSETLPDPVASTRWWRLW